MWTLPLFGAGLIVGALAETTARGVSPRFLRGTLPDGTEVNPRRQVLVGAITGVLFALSPIVLGWSWVLPAYLLFIWLTMTLSLTDLDTKLIPNRILLPGTLGATALLGLGSFVEQDGTAFARGLGGGALYFAGLLLVALVARGGFGFGDVKLALVLGVFTAYRSWGVLAVAVFLAFLGGGLVALVLLVTRLRSRKDAIPFGPFLVAGAYLGIALGADIVDWYLG